MIKEQFWKNESNNISWEKSSKPNSRCDRLFPVLLERSDCREARGHTRSGELVAWMSERRGRMGEMNNSWRREMLKGKGDDGRTPSLRERDRAHRHPLRCRQRTNCYCRAPCKIVICERRTSQSTTESIARRNRRKGAEQPPPNHRNRGPIANRQRREEWRRSAGVRRTRDREREGEALRSC